MPRSRFVLDTSTLVSALRSDAGASRRLLSAAFAHQITLLVSVPLMLEYEAVMTRTEHLERSGLSESLVGDLLDTLADHAEPVPIAFLWRPGLLDPNDDMILEVAVNGRADAVVTFNSRHFIGLKDRFGIDVISPGIAWKAVEALS